MNTSSPEQDSVEKGTSVFARHRQRPGVPRVDGDVNVLVLGSAPEAEVLKDMDLTGLTLVTLNNAWRIRTDADYIIFPNNFPEENRPSRDGPIKRVWEKAYRKRIAAFGGLLFTGSTMAFNAAYWALATRQPALVGFFASDMVYNGRQTHFYGKGEADPLRENITLRSLEAKSIRLFAFGLATGTVVVNFSMRPVSRLMLPRMPLSTVLRPTGLQVLRSASKAKRQSVLTAIHQNPLTAELVAAAEAIVQREESPPFVVDTNNYWSLVDDESAIAFLDDINQAWLDLTPLVLEVARPLYGLSAQK